MAASDGAHSGDYVGWAVGALMILLIAGVAMGLWIHYHGI